MRRLDLESVPRESIERFRLDRIPVDRAQSSTADLLRLDGKCALVTGGGGDGLGNAICHRLAEQGASVAIVDVDAGAAERAAVELRDRWGATAYAVVADVSSAGEVARAVSQINSQAGRIDILVNNVGGSGGVNSSGVAVPSGVDIADLTAEQIDASVAVNLVSALYLCRSVVASMLADGVGGRIIFISSEFGRIGYPGATVYSACKAALIGLTRSLAREVGPHGVSPVCVAPGLIVGERMLDALSDPNRPQRPFEFSLERSTIGRAAVVDEVASLVGFLASAAGAYIHGTTVSVGGGMSD